MELHIPFMNFLSIFKLLQIRLPSHSDSVLLSPCLPSSHIRLPSRLQPAPWSPSGRPRVGAHEDGANSFSGRFAASPEPPREDRKSCIYKNPCSWPRSPTRTGAICLILFGRKHGHNPAWSPLLTSPALLCPSPSPSHSTPQGPAASAHEHPDS